MRLYIDLLRHRFRMERILIRAIKVRLYVELKRNRYVMQLLSGRAPALGFTSPDPGGVREPCRASIATSPHWVACHSDWFA